MQATGTSARAIALQPLHQCQQATARARQHPPAGFQSTSPTSGRWGKAADRQLRKALQGGTGLWPHAFEHWMKRGRGLLAAPICSTSKYKQLAWKPCQGRLFPSPGCRERCQRSAAAAAAADVAAEGRVKRGSGQGREMPGRTTCDDITVRKLPEACSCLPGTLRLSQSPEPAVHPSGAAVEQEAQQLMIAVHAASVPFNVASATSPVKLRTATASNQSWS